MRLKTWMLALSLPLILMSAVQAQGVSVTTGDLYCTVRCTSGKTITFKASSPCYPFECAYVCDESGNGDCATDKNGECMCGPARPSPVNPQTGTEAAIFGEATAVAVDCPVVVSATSAAEEGQRFASAADFLVRMTESLSASGEQAELVRDLEGLANKYSDLGESLRMVAEEKSGTNLGFLTAAVTVGATTTACIDPFKCTDQDGTAVEIWGFNSCNKCDVSRGPGCKACCKHFTGNADDVRCSCDTVVVAK
ncbi:MAG TPA: hypothetical protein VLQ45_17925 [Thermoanaerobaculia bacterium]|nr:hypothetical protein [Thermoanaerobaculia bacterium]